MNIYILDKQLNIVDSFDFYNSIIWSNRYYKTGDFELQIPLTERVDKSILQDYFIFREVDYQNGIVNRPKIIERIELINNSNNNSLLVSGRDSTALLERRIIYPTEILSGNYEESICNLINTHAIEPSDANRKIDILQIINTGLITETIDTQITGDTLLKYIEDSSADYKIGFRTDLDIANKKLLFKMYIGDDKTSGNNKVIISRSYDNLIKDYYVNDKEKYKNMAYVAGAGEGSERKLVKLNDELTGIDRRELFVDARDLQEKDAEGRDIPVEEYMEQLTQRGSEKLSENKVDVTNSCEAETDGVFVFNKDYFVGDIVICKGYKKFNERIVETIESNTAAGVKTELTFEEVEND